MASLPHRFASDLSTAWTEHSPYVKFAVGIFVVGMVLGTLMVGEVDLWGALGVESAQDLFPDRITLWSLFLNNSIAMAGMVLGAITLGLFTVFGLALNGILLGYLGVPIAHERGIDFLLIGILPHGIIELPAFFIAGGIGFRLVSLAGQRVIGRRDRFLQRGDVRRMAVLFGVAWVALAVAAVIELYVTAGLLEALYG